MLTSGRRVARGLRTPLTACGRWSAANIGLFTFRAAGAGGPAAGHRDEAIALLDVAAVDRTLIRCLRLRISSSAMSHIRVDSAPLVLIDPAWRHAVMTGATLRLGDTGGHVRFAPRNHP